jgi:hypothetical protein
MPGVFFQGFIKTLLPSSFSSSSRPGPPPSTWNGVTNISGSENRARILWEFQTADFPPVSRRRPQAFCPRKSASCSVCLISLKNTSICQRHRYKLAKLRGLDCRCWSKTPSRAPRCRFPPTPLVGGLHGQINTFFQNRGTAEFVLLPPGCFRFAVFKKQPKQRNNALVIRQQQMRRQEPVVARAPRQD